MQLAEAVETFDCGDFVLDEVEVGELGEVRDLFDVFYFVEGEVEGGEVC